MSETKEKHEEGKWDDNSGGKRKVELKTKDKT